MTEEERLLEELKYLIQDKSIPWEKRMSLLPKHRDSEGNVISDLNPPTLSGLFKEKQELLRRIKPPETGLPPSLLEKLSPVQRELAMWELWRKQAPERHRRAIGTI